MRVLLAPVVLFVVLIVVGIAVVGLTYGVALAERLSDWLRGIL